MAGKRTMPTRQGGEAQYKVLYTDTQRLQAVKLLRENNFDYKATSSMLNVSQATLRSWASRYRDVHTTEKVELMQERVELDLAKVKLDFISKNYRQMDNLAKTAIDRALTLIQEETDLSKVNNTIKILTDFFAKMHQPGDTSSDQPGSTVTVNLIQQSIMQLNQLKTKE